MALEKYLFEKIQSLCLKKTPTVSTVIEKLVEHGIHCLPCAYLNDIIDILSYQL